MGHIVCGLRGDAIFPTFGLRTGNDEHFMELRALIVDNEDKARENLRVMLAEYCPEVVVVGVADAAASALTVIRKLKPDLVFLDVEMPGGSGFEVLKYASPIDFEIVFVTAFSKYGAQAFEFSALHYITKPINPLKLQEAVHRFAQKCNPDLQQKKVDVLQANLAAQQVRKIALPTLEGYDFLEIDSIVHCQADGNYTKLHRSSDKALLVSRKLKEIAEMLPQGQFFRVHHSHLIHRQHIERYVRGKGGYVILSDGSKVDVSVRRRDDFLQWMHES